MNNDKRFDYIDSAKAFGMMAVMWGHIHFNDISTYFVYAFHIPLFFFLSGMVFVPEKYGGFKSFVVRKVKSLLIPYVIYSVITWMIWVAYVSLTRQQVDSIWAPLLETLLARGSEGYLIHNAPLWFVPCLFVVELIYYWISKLPDWFNLMVDVILAVSGYSLVTYSKFYDFTTLPWSIDVAMMAILFYATGHLVVKRFGHAKIISSINAKPWLFASFALLLFVGVYYVASYNGYPSMGHAQLNDPLLFYSGAYMGTSAMIVICALVANHISTNKLWRCMLWFGCSSFIAMAIHMPIKGFVTACVSKLLGMTPTAVKTSVSLGIVIWVIVLAITSVMMYFIVRFKKRLNKKVS